MRKTAVQAVIRRQITRKAAVQAVIRCQRIVQANSSSSYAVNALILGDAWLNLPSGSFTEMQPGIYARRDFAMSFIDVSVALSQHGVAYRATFRQSNGWQMACD